MSTKIKKIPCFPLFYSNLLLKKSLPPFVGFSRTYPESAIRFLSIFAFLNIHLTNCPNQTEFFFDDDDDDGDDDILH